MNAEKILEGGLTGAATLTLLSKTLSKIDSKSTGIERFGKKGIVRQIKKKVQKKGFKAVKAYIQLASELLGMAGALGLAGINKKKNMVLKGGLLGGLAGIAVAFLQNDENNTEEKDQLKNKLVTVSLYIIAGLIAGQAARSLIKKKKKK
jgi:hypothetical protein